MCNCGYCAYHNLGWIGKGRLCLGVARLALFGVEMPKMAQNRRIDSQPLTRRGRNQSGSVVLTVATTLLLRVVLDFTYVNYVDKFFASELSAGVFALTKINAIQLFESYVVALMLSIWLVISLYRRWQPSGIALLFYFVFVILPLSSLHGLTDAPASFFYAATGSFAVLIIVTGLLPKVKVARPGHDFVYLGLIMTLGISLYVYGWLILSGGLRRFNLDLLSVYEVRAEYLQAQGPFLGYFVPWQANAINILLLLYAVYRRKYWLAAIAFVAQLILFGMTGHKSFLLAPVLAIGVYVSWKKHALFWILGGAVLIVGGSYLAFLITGNHLVPSLLIRRLFFVPAASHLIYYDFFSRSENPYVMLSNSILGLFLHYPYDAPIPIVIAEKYWGSQFWPNVGYLGDAFAHFGFKGMFLFSILLGVFLRALDSVGSKQPSHFIAAIISVPAMALVNSGLFTSSLTHGFVLSLAMLWLLSGRLGNKKV